MATKAKRQKNISNLIVVTLISLIIAIGIKDAVDVFADAMLPLKTVTLRIAPCADSNVRELTIVFEDKDDEIFNLLRNQIDSDGEDGKLNGWRYTEGDLGVSWTRIQAAEAGDEITISAKADPDYYFAVFSDQWSGAFQMSIDGGEPHYIDCYQEISSPDILRIRPFEFDRAHKIIRGVCYLLALAILFSLVFIISVKMRSDNPQETLYPILLVVICVSVFSMYFLFLNQARGFFPSDLPAHLRGAVTNRGYSISHFMLGVSYKALGYYGCALYLTVVTVGTMFMAGWTIRILQKQASSGKQIPWTAAFLIGIAVCYTGSIFLPNVYPLFYLYHDYTGVGTASSIVTQPWHNSTYTLMRFFGIITLILYIRIKSKYLESGIRIREWIAFTLALTLANAAKPNFFIAFAPAMLIVLIYDFIRNKGRGFLRMVLFGFGVLCSMPVLFFQKGSLFPESAVTEEGSAVYGTKVTTRVVEKMWNNGVFRPLLVTGLSFFLIVTIVCIIKGAVKDYLVFSWLMLVIALLTSWFVVETGPRENAGNFGWGVPFCAFSLLIICIERLIALKPRLSRSALLLMLSPLVLMMVSGICYYAHLLGGGGFIA